ncbi:MoxR-like ATPase [Primorskyibacter sedentarius]|uniref:MoxR-like ATPase n=1 Tax=Primorskyibacter sedentarius TaxID=745311 RepID=A0A4R3JF63_9RHOB|nr:AAA family ATPase [Primorskyibacter sedentarius]TCS64474.1 MoxR-like ATPase [Primorskyibacter sedentarius]
MTTVDASVRTASKTLASQLRSGLIGHEKLIRRLLIALLSGGHLLIEGPPGLAKTRAVKALSDAVAGSFARIQCTPDLMPSDLTGTQIYRPQTQEFEFVPGPIFHNLVLVDEINRAPPKVQSALLEAMAEHQVTAGNQTHTLPDPFLVVATQNPIEHDGTFPLPEAQLDRFLLHVELSLPDAEAERRILDLVEEESRGPVPASYRMPLEDINAARAEAMSVHLAPELRDYIVQLVVATRDEVWAQDIEHAVSPRGSLSLAAAAKASAYLDGRDYARPEDVAELAPDALAHRMVLSWRAVAEGRTARDVVADILSRVDPL